MPTFYLASKHRPGASVPMRVGSHVEWSLRSGRPAIVHEIEPDEYGFVSMITLQYPRGMVTLTAKQLSGLRSLDAVVRDGKPIEWVEQATAITTPPPHDPESGFDELGRPYVYHMDGRIIGYYVRGQEHYYEDEQ